MAIQHDSQGFLLGDPVDIGGALSALNDIRDDIHAIRSALSGKGLDEIGINIPRPKLRRIYDDSPTSIPTNTTITPNAKRSSPLSVVSSAIQRSNVVEPRRSTPAHAANKRDEKGRFTGNGLKQSNDRVVESDSDAANATALRDAATKIVDAVSSAGSGIEESDPAVKAINEIAQPAARGYEMLFSGNNKEEKRKEGWFRKILNELKIFRKEESIFNKAANSSLKNLEDGQMAGDGGGGSSWLRRYILPLAIGFLGWLVSGSSKGLIQKFSEAHNRAMEAYVFAPIRKISDGLTALIDSVSSKIEGAWNAFTGFIKDKTGIDIQSSVNAVKEKVSDGVNAIKESRVGKAVSGVIDNISEGANSAKDWVLGQTSKFFESGNGGAGTVSIGKGDFGGVSYGTYQLSSSRGRVQEFLKSTKYGEQFSGMEPGTPEFNAMWKKVAQSDPGFDKAQYEFIKSTHFDPQMAKLKKSGIDLTGRGSAVQDAVWSTSVQFGGNTSLIEKALNGKDASQMTDRDIVSAIQDYKIANNESLFRSSDSKNRAGTANRAVEEKKRLIALAEGSAQSVDPVNIGQIPTASASIPSAPNLPQPIKLSEAPQIESLIGSAGAGRNQTTVQVAQQDVGQDVRDRGIAHIVTGGLSN